ncbi:MAG: hypothetical protein ACFCUJ_01540 [Thiotrichales bacterium]
MANPVHSQSPLLVAALQHLTLFLRSRRAFSAYLAMAMLDRLSHDPGASEETRAAGRSLADRIDTLCRTLDSEPGSSRNALPWGARHVSH